MKDGAILEALAEEIMEDKYYFVAIIGCVEPEVHGPFKTPEERVVRARTHNTRLSLKDGIYWADIIKGELVVGSFMASSMEDGDYICESEGCQTTVVRGTDGKFRNGARLPDGTILCTACDLTSLKVEREAAAR